MTAIDPADIDRCRRAAAFYRRLGYNPLPSRTDRKMPWLKGGYAKLRDEGIKERIVERWWSPNCQVVTGARWNLAVVDIDGPEAQDVWRAWTAFDECPPTWEVISPGGGRHLWFSTSPSASSPASPSACLWRGPSPHSGIELLGDRRLIVAPPSIHPGTGTRYAFAPGCSPRDVRRPAPLPGWLARLAAPRPRALVALPRCHAAACPGHSGYDAGMVAHAVPDLPALAEGWGLRVVGRMPNRLGWLRCRAIGREDEHPSASFNAESGFYWEPGAKLNLFEVAAALGIYPTWRDALADLGRRHGVPPLPRSA